MLRARPLTPVAFARFGTVVQAPAGPGRAINEGTTERFDLLADLQLDAAGGKPLLAIYRAQARRFPHAVRELEHHAFGSQTFIPLGRRRFVLVVAPPGAAPAADAVEAFVTDGEQGVVLHPATWHHGLLALDAGDFAVIERGSAHEDCITCALAPALQVVLP